MPSLYVKTLGCKVNTFDGHALENQFVRHGYDLLSAPEGADVTIVNSCSVTASAEREARYLARRYRRENPSTMLVVTGCYAQVDSARLVAMDEVDLVIPNEVKERLVTIVEQSLTVRHQGAKSPKMPEGLPEVRENRQSHFKSSASLFDRADSNQTRAFVKIQDGCNGFCTYCLIPYARGASRSVPPHLVVEECARLIAAGTTEIVLTGIHLGDYGRDLADLASAERNPIVSMVRRLLSLPGLGRLRLSSLEPAELTQDLVDLLAEHRHLVCDHLHLPLQSGADRILKQMRRTYDSSGYEAAVHRFRAAFPDGAVGADVIPGFPSETDEEFAETLSFVRRLGLSYLHVFPYSSRPNTAAARMPGHIDARVVHERAQRLRALSSELAEQFARQFIGRTAPVLWEKEEDEQGRRSGYTSNYISVVTGDSRAIPGSITPCLLKGFVRPGQLLGRPM